MISFQTPMDLLPLNITNNSSNQPMIIAGPCSAETQEQVLETARQLANNGIKLFRAGIWKPRTKPGGFEGVGSIGLSWLAQVKRETGMLVATEVATRQHVRESLDAGIDILWIGARTTVNPFAVQEIADALRGVNIPVLVKNPVNPDLELWIGALERLRRNGIRRLGAIHRGFSSGEKTRYRNQPMWEIPLELKRRIPNLPIICDPSHIAGCREGIEPLSQKAMKYGFSGLLVESHTRPDSALSDAAQQLTPDVLKTVVDNLAVSSPEHSGDPLVHLRDRIDWIDEQLLELLSKRMSISCEIGAYKNEHDIPVLQPSRLGEMLQNRVSFGRLLQLNPRFVKGILREIHDESVRLQTVSSKCGEECKNE